MSKTCSYRFISSHQDMVQLETQGKYDPWGKPGGGAPITKEDHKLRRLNPQAIISPNQAGGVPIFVVSKTVMSFIQQSNKSQSFLTPLCP